MTVIYQTNIVNEQRYITGWISSSDSGAVELDSQLQNITQWYDANNNPIWVLKDDGTVVQIPISVNLVTDTLIAQKAIDDNQAVLNTMLVDVVNSLVNVTAIDDTTKSKWNQACGTVQTAFASIPGLTKG